MRLFTISNYINSQSFKSTYTVDTGSATSKQQIFTLGALMNNFWVNNAATTFNRIKKALKRIRKECSNLKEFSDRFIAFEKEELKKG